MVDWGKMKLELGQKYKSPRQLKVYVNNYAIANGYNLRFAKSDYNMLLVVCRKASDKTKCLYRFYASWIGHEICPSEIFK